MPKVYNKYHKHPEGCVNIMRPNKYGNPFKIPEDGTRTEVIAMFRQYCKEHPEYVEDIRKNLKGKDLLCCCKPSACHGDVLLEIANAETIEDFLK